MRTKVKSEVVTIFGGSGYVGRHLVQRLASEGYRIRVAVRRPHEVPEMRVAGDIGQIQLIQANVRNRASVARAIHGSDIVINLVALLYQVGPQKFRPVHVEGARHVAEEAARAGVSRLIHMSALGADKSSRSLYAQTKAEGEDEVRTAFPDAVILRPSVIFGPEDGFYGRLASMVRMMPVVPVIGFGKTRFQPVYIHDLIDALCAAMTRADVEGKTFELGGPEVVTLKTVLQELARDMGRPRLFVPLPFWIAKIDAWFLQLVKILRLRPALTVDQVKLLQSDNVVEEGKDGVHTFADLGVTELAGPEALVPRYLTRFRKRGQFEHAPTVKAPE